MTFIEIIKSEYDSTLKYIFKTADNLIVEFSYIDKNDGKDIICVPSQTMCNLACKFCHTTDYIGKIRNENLIHYEIIEFVTYIIDDLKLKDNRVLLISFMGCGEPILNVDNIIESMIGLKKLEQNGFSYVRFAIATSLPKNRWLNFYKLVDGIKNNDLPVKIHLSLHYTMDIIRKEWMPASLDIMSSLSCIDFYRKLTKNPVEIHYTLIDGVNDTEQDAILLSTFLKDKDINVKFLFFNEKKSIDYHASSKEKLKIFKRYFDKYSIDHEYYTPPGLDIGASCGQFLMDTYIKHQIETND
jgi:23S rRNA (adenine2503-C2)-methyltransferase